MDTNKPRSAFEEPDYKKMLNKPKAQVKAKPKKRKPKVDLIQQAMAEHERTRRPYKIINKLVN